MRYALYFTPPMSEPLTRAASRWLGRDAFSGEIAEPPGVGAMASDEIAYHTAAPRRYGFHATLKAPFRLADSAMEPEFLSEIMHFASGFTPFVLPPLRITRIGPFFALTLSQPCEALQAFADQVVMHFDGFRAPMSDAELERRSNDQLTQRQLEYLGRWGYPYVFDSFRFHMTLTGPVDDSDAERVEAALETFFASVVDRPVAFSSLALFVEPQRDAPLVVNSLHPLGQVAQRKSATH